MVVSLAYRLAPEHRYTDQLDDVTAAIRWLAAHGDELGGDPTRLGVGGDSAGGNLSAGATLRLRDEGGPRVDVQVLIYAATVPYFDTLSYHENAEGYWLTRGDVMWFWDNFLGPDPGRPPRPVRSARHRTRSARPATDPRHHRRLRPAARRGRGLRLQAAGCRSARPRAPVQRHDPRVRRAADADPGRRAGSRPDRRDHASRLAAQGQGHSRAAEHRGAHEDHRTRDDPGRRDPVPDLRPGPHGRGPHRDQRHLLRDRGHPRRHPRVGGADCCSARTRARSSATGTRSTPTTRRAGAARASRCGPSPRSTRRCGTSSASRSGRPIYAAARRPRARPDPDLQHLRRPDVRAPARSTGCGEGKGPLEDLWA